MLRVHTSHRTEVLLDAFVRALVDERQARSPFVPIQVVVPNKNIETYLRLGVAERTGIAANLTTSFLRRYLANLATQVLPDARVADASVVEAHLLAVLHDAELLGRPELARVQAYLRAAGGDRDAIDRRRCQLAASLGHLFDEYASSRPGLIAAWRNDDASEPRGEPPSSARRGPSREGLARPSEASGEGVGGEGPRAERTLSGFPSQWQRLLWLAVFGPDGRLARVPQGTRWLTLEALWDEAMACSPATFAGHSVHVFGLSYIATAYHRMLRDLGRSSQVTVYTLNPCREDIPAQGVRDELLPDTVDLHPALALWARPGRENLQLLSRLDGATVVQEFPAGDGTTLLRRLQQDLVGRRGPTQAVALDDSLRVLPCPSLRRELEVVAAEIWSLLRSDATLRACDIAVVVPETCKQLYLAQLPAVFHESCDLPHNASDLPAASSHRVAAAIARLVELPFSDFTRRDLLPLLTDPCLMARFPGAEGQAWRQLADDLGIVRGADRSAFATAYLDRDVYSWDQGLTRLALGAVVDDAGVPLAFGDDLYLPGPPLDPDEAGLGFGLLARSLLADAAFATGKHGPRERPLGEWFDFIRGMLRTYLVLDDEDDAGRGVVASFLSALDDLGGAGVDDVPVSYRVAAELAGQALASLPSSRGHYLASGVSVASFVPMRAIPFRAVFVVGLGPDAFPRPPGRDELDLRRDSRLPGDVDRREQDLYMFLETLLSTRDRLCLSYVCRDEITGDELPASPLLLELRAMLGRGYLDEGQLARLFRDARADRPPLRRYDDCDERRAVLPAAELEHQAKRRRQATDASRPAPAHVLVPATAATETAPSSVLDLPLWVLRRFLDDPLQASARFQLGMRADPGEDLADVEDEPFDLAKSLTSSIVRESMVSTLLAAQGRPAWEDLDGARRAQVLATELAGQSPAGVFRAAGVAATEHILRAWHEGLQEVLGQGSLPCRIHRFVADHDALGAALSPLPTLCHPAPCCTVELPGHEGRAPRRITVRIVGDGGVWAAPKDGSELALSFTCRSGVEPRKLGKEDLRVFLEYAVLAAASTNLLGGRSALFYAKGDDADQRVWRFGALEATRARAYLTTLCTELLAGALDASGAPSFVHAYLLPGEAVLASRRNGTAVVDEIEKLRSETRPGSPGTNEGPLRDARSRFAPPVEAEAERMVEARFGLFFALDQGEEKP